MIKQGNNHIERDGNGMPITILNYEDFRGGRLKGFHLY